MSRILNLPGNIAINIQQPYEAGHVMTELEASKINQVLLDNIRTTLLTKIKKALKDDPNADVSGLAGEFQSFADSYSFSVRTTRTPSDPVLKEAHKIAKEQVFATIRQHGGDPKDYPAEKIAEYVAIVLERKPEIKEEAKRRIESSREIASTLLDDLFAKVAE